MPTLKNRAYRMANKILPKLDRVLVTGSDKVESNAIETANYIAAHYNIPVYFGVSPLFHSCVEQLLDTKIKIVDMSSIRFLMLTLTSKYIFSTHGSSLAGSTRRQTEVNIWHGVGHKKIRLLRGESGITADITVATSALTGKMFSECFGVPSESIVISGYPRNDLMLRSKNRKAEIRKRIKPDLNRYDKILFWMPTFRRKSPTEMMNVRRGLKLDNPFEVEGFDIEQFNTLLREQNTICLLKPHYFYLTADHDFNYSNILMIDDEWVCRQGITLYELIACTDVLVTDFSSVMLDYTLLEQPIVCFCTDLEDYKATQGLYFDDIENWIPSELIQNQASFFHTLRQILDSGIDPHQNKRVEIRDRFFNHLDANSTMRLTEHVFGSQVAKYKSSQNQNINK
jgi:CDP-glycerol glycerophosphotransferase (TagB/SpsB family)